MVRYSFFYSAWITGKSFFHWILCNAARMYQKLKECFTESCYIINERPWPCWCWCKTEKNIETSLILSKNPNRLWHLDSYDKFKPFGFEILGCIDGYSRCILRLNILRSNKDPKVVYNVFVNYMKVTKGVRGTWNVLIKRSQRYLRRNHGDDLVRHSSFLFEKSRLVGTIFQRTCSQWYIQQHRIFTSRVFQICNFSCDSKRTTGYLRRLEQSSYSTITPIYQWRQACWSIESISMSLTMMTFV